MRADDRKSAQSFQVFSRSARNWTSIIIFSIFGNICIDSWYGLNVTYKLRCGILHKPIKKRKQRNFAKNLKLYHTNTQLPWKIPTPDIKCNRDTCDSRENTRFYLKYKITSQTAFIVFHFRDLVFLYRQNSEWNHLSPSSLQCSLSPANKAISRQEELSKYTDDSHHVDSNKEFDSEFLILDYFFGESREKGILKM